MRCPQQNRVRRIAGEDQKVSKSGIPKGCGLSARSAEHAAAVSQGTFGLSNQKLLPWPES